ncbi:uncharacterized protein LOC133797497 [Humulus lupulus]|uniref:uncharacterized protein LOC133797497 n=1 Tax=Humulus lupulus TaxID=3486 RepID=UPI002B4108F6|nr:uncharacterized protein LOC133797497 [Humulus lupulus]
MDSVILKPTFDSFSFSLSTPKTKPLSVRHFSFFRFPYKLRTSSISVSYRPLSTPSNPQNPESNSFTYDYLLKPLTILAPILQSLKTSLFARTHRWVSSIQASRDSEKVVDGNGVKYLQSSGLGIALLSVTTNAKVKISPVVAQLAANPTFVSGMFAWFFAQSTKVLLNFFVEKKWDFRFFFASGGMPSSHSALCTALSTSVALCHGVADSLFPVCLGFSLIVMYDAIGVRRHAGMQAEVLNMIVEDLFQGHPISQRKLKELLGHTPSQVLAGAVLGIVVACVCCQGNLVAA